MVSLPIAGGNVNGKDAGFANSDWPRSNGQWFPKIVGDVFREQGYRLVAMSFGFLTIGLVIYVLAVESRSWVRKLSMVALAGVIAQGLLGGLTVKLMLPLAVSAAHATLAQIFFCTVVSLAVFTSPSWLREQKVFPDINSPSLRALGTAAAVTIFFQLILGATLRHSAPWDRYLPTELVIAHIGGAIAVTLMLSITAAATFRRQPGNSYLAVPARFALGFLAVQLGLGVTAYLTRLQSPAQPQPLSPMVAITVAHVACGALVFSSTIVLTLRVYRVHAPTAHRLELATA